MELIWRTYLTLAAFLCLSFARRDQVEIKKAASSEKSSSPSLSSSSPRVIGKYARYHEMLEYLHQLNSSVPEVGRLHVIGNTYEGRPMTVMQLGIERNFPKKRIWIDGGTHGGEHISPATVLYFIHRFVSGFLQGDNELRNLLKTFDWFFLPVLNPDGYEFTFTTNRMWRKNRRPVSYNCYGVDLNRNWNFKWGGEILQADSEVDPCGSTYRGEFSESELEIVNVEKFLLTSPEQFVAFVTYHSYGQRIFTRWDYTDSRVPENNEELILLANRMSDAIAEVSGMTYNVGSAPSLTYAFGGGSADWAMEVAGIEYSYLIELRDTGVKGFLLPESEIIPTGEENWAAILELGRYLKLKSRIFANKDYFKNENRFIQSYQTEEFQLNSVFSTIEDKNYTLTNGQEVTKDRANSPTHSHNFKKRIEETNLDLLIVNKSHRPPKVESFVSTDHNFMLHISLTDSKGSHSFRKTYLMAATAMNLLFKIYR